MAKIPDAVPGSRQANERLRIGSRTTEGGLYPAWGQVQIQKIVVNTT